MEQNLEVYRSVIATSPGPAPLPSLQAPNASVPLKPKQLPFRHCNYSRSSFSHCHQESCTTCSLLTADGSHAGQAPFKGVNTNEARWRQGQPGGLHRRVVHTKLLLPSSQVAPLRPPGACVGDPGARARACKTSAHALQATGRRPPAQHTRPPHPPALCLPASLPTAP